jgi:hypothetical protein
MTDTLITGYQSRNRAVITPADWLLSQPELVVIKRLSRLSKRALDNRTNSSQVNGWQSFRNLGRGVKIERKVLSTGSSRLAIWWLAAATGARTTLRVRNNRQKKLNEAASIDFTSRARHGELAPRTITLHPPLFGQPRAADSGLPRRGPPLARLSCRPMGSPGKHSRPSRTPTVRES